MGRFSSHAAPHASTNAGAIEDPARHGGLRSQMKYFSQALKDASRHKFIIAAAMACSLAVAALWSLNIAALFPIIQTTLNGQSLQSWNQERLERAESEFADFQAEIVKLDEQLKDAAPQDRNALELTRGQLEGQSKKAKITAEWTAKIQLARSQ